MLDERIEKAIIKENARLFILDPIQAYVGNGVDINRANEVRPLLKNLMQIAQRTNCAIEKTYTHLDVGILIEAVNQMYLPKGYEK